MDRTILIGDLHGCVEEARDLLRACDYDPSTDRVILLGDLVDRGEHSDLCVELAMDLEQAQGSPSCILGNHESRHIWYMKELERLGKLPDSTGYHADTRAQLKPHHYVYMRSLPLFMRLPEHNVVAVHAGVFPGLPIEAQDQQHLLHVQMLNPSASTKSRWPSKIPQGEEEQWKFWTHFWHGPETLVFGHTFVDKPLITEHVVGIDGGCVFGRKLHAYILPDKRIVSVNARANYAEKGHRGNQLATIKTFNLHDDVNTCS